MNAPDYLGNLNGQDAITRSALIANVRVAHNASYIGCVPVVYRFGVCHGFL